MHYGELLYEGHWYYFDLLTGAMQTGFLQIAFESSVLRSENGTNAIWKTRDRWFYV